jgi:tRNA(adenine34) deaminase
MMIHPNSADCSLMKIALEEAEKAEQLGEVPIGAVLIVQGRMFRGHNRVITESDPSAHAEMVVIREAARGIGNYRLSDSQLIVTLEPCLMCAGAIVQARIVRIVFGARDERYGALGSLLNAFQLGLNHTPAVVGEVMQAECSAVLKEFFQARR